MKIIRPLAATILIIFYILLAPASAAVWSWGCAGPLGNDQMVFNRDRLVVVAGKAPVGKLDDLVQGGSSAIEALAKRKGVTIQATYLPDDGNGGLEAKMSFTSDSDKTRKLVLTEQSSKKTGSSAKLLFGCRDEIKDRFTKTFKLEISGEPARTVTLQCMDYTLSTKGGRTCR